MYLNFEIPEPLDEPQCWLERLNSLGPPTEAVILDWDFWAHGAAQNFIDQIRDSRRPLIWRVTLPSHLASGIDQLSWNAPVERLLGSLSNDVRFAVNVIGGEAVSPEDLLAGVARKTGLPLASLRLEDVTDPAPTHLQWAIAIDPRLANLQTPLSALIGDYLGELKGRLSHPWFDLRYFAGFLRQKKHLVAAQEFHERLSFFEALFSSHDEENERCSLKGGEVALNPTLQTMRFDQNPTDRHLRVYARWSGRVASLTLTLHQAAVLDAFIENGRSDRAFILDHVQNETAFARPGLETALDELIAAHMVLAEAQS